MTLWPRCRLLCGSAFSLTRRLPPKAFLEPKGSSPIPTSSRSSQAPGRSSITRHHQDAESICCTCVCIRDSSCYVIVCLIDRNGCLQKVVLCSAVLRDCLLVLVLVFPLKSLLYSLGQNLLVVQLLPLMFIYFVCFCDVRVAHKLR